MTQGIKEQIVTLPAIKPEFHFGQICRKVLRTHAMPCADDATLQKRACVLDGIRMNVPIYIDLGFVLDSLVWGSDFSRSERTGISIVFVGHDHIYIAAHVLPNELCQCATLGIFGMKETK